MSRWSGTYVQLKLKINLDLINPDVGWMCACVRARVNTRVDKIKLLLLYVLQ